MEASLASFPSWVLQACVKSQGTHAQSKPLAPEGEAGSWAFPPACMPMGAALGLWQEDD